MRRFVQKGHQVRVATSTIRLPAVADETDDADAERVHRVLRAYWRDFEPVHPSMASAWRTEVDNARALRALIELHRPDVISVWNMAALSLGLLIGVAQAGLPMVFVVCDDWLLHGVSLDPWARRLAGRRRLATLLARTTRMPTSVPDLGQLGGFAFISDFTRRRAEQETGWAFPRATVSHSGIDHDMFTPLAAPPGPRPWRWRLLFVGRAQRDKGVHTAIAALEHLPAEAKLDVVGRASPSERSACERVARSVGAANRVNLDAVAREQLPSRYAAADVTLFPSEWDEPFGLVPLESMALGTPVVATGTGGSAEFLLDGGNCLRFPSGDARALAAAILRLSEDAELRQRLAAGGLVAARELSIPAWADDLESWHLAAAGRWRHGVPPPRPRFSPRTDQATPPKEGPG